jgi:hypothetical protein
MTCTVTLVVASTLGLTGVTAAGENPAAARRLTKATRRRRRRINPWVSPALASARASGRSHAMASRPARRPRARVTASSVAKKCITRPALARSPVQREPCRSPRSVSWPEADHTGHPDHDPEKPERTKRICIRPDSPTMAQITPQKRSSASSRAPAVAVQRASSLSQRSPGVLAGPDGEGSRLADAKKQTMASRVAVLAARARTLLSRFQQTATLGSGAFLEGRSPPRRLRYRSLKVAWRPDRVAADRTTEALPPRPRQVIRRGRQVIRRE